ncbi:MAG: FAD-dependent oxidoreductase [Microbacterium sp.]
MSDAVGPLENLAEHAHETHVVVVGAGIAGLVAALECAKVGLRVTLLEARAELGGTIRGEQVGGELVDVGADGWSVAGGHVRRLLDELGLAGAVVPETPVAPWVGGISSGAAPLPPEAVLGIPANTWDPAVRRIIGWGGVWRAYLDRLRPPLTIGQERNLGTLVRSRMGARVEARLVAPLTYGRHGILPTEVDVDVASPGLNAALTRTGSLGGAVAQVRGGVDRGPSNETLEGGMSQLVEALRQRLTDLGAEIRTDSPVDALEPAESGRWSIVTPDDRLLADAVVVATPEGSARRLLAPHADGVAAGDGAERVLDVATLVVESAALTAPPRSGVVYAVPETGPASGVTVTTARWAWLAARLGDSRHVVRVQFPGGAPEGDSILIAREAASALLGVTISAGDVLGARVDRFAAALPPSALGQPAEAHRARAAVRAIPGLGVVGAWIAGSGLAHVIPDTLEEAERVRRHALFGEEAAD